MGGMCIFAFMEKQDKHKKEQHLKLKTSVSKRGRITSLSDEDMREMERRYDENEEFQYRFAYWNMEYTHTDF